MRSSEQSGIDQSCRQFINKCQGRRGKLIDAFELYDDLSEAIGNLPNKEQFQNVVQVLQTEFSCRIVALDDLLQQKYAINEKQQAKRKRYNKLPDKQLIRIYQDQQEEEALVEFINRNIGLVNKEVRRYIGLSISLDEDDLRQLGIIGMIVGVRKFDLSMDNAVSTYLVHWIRQSITRGIQEEGYLIRLPAHLHETLQRLNRLERNRLTLQWDEADVSEAMDISLKRYYQLRHYSELYLKHASLNTPVGEDGEGGDTELMEMLPSTEQILPEDVMIKNALRENLGEVLETLTPREKKVIRLRFGLDNDQEQTLEEIGADFGLTRERIRQIEAKALKKLRHPSCSKKIKDFL